MRNWARFTIRKLIQFADLSIVVLDEDDMVSNSAVHVVTQQSLVAYVAGVGGGLSDPIEYNAATDTPSLVSSPSGISAGDFHYVTVAGTFFTTPVNVNDHLIANKDNPTVEADWIIGGHGGGVFTDDLFEIKNAADNTKLIKFDAALIATSQTRTIEMPDADVKLHKDLLNATVDPTVSNDNTQGYSVGSIWFNTTASPVRAFLCKDASTGAADWKPIATEFDDLTAPPDDRGLFYDFSNSKPDFWSNGNTMKFNGLVFEPTIVDNVIAGTSHTMLQSDKGKRLRFTNAGAIALDLDTGDLSDDFFCTILQEGAGQITIGGTATIEHADDFFVTEKEDVVVGIECTATDVFLLSGRLVP